MHLMYVVALVTHSYRSLLSFSDLLQCNILLCFYFLSLCWSILPIPDYIPTCTLPRKILIIWRHCLCRKNSLVINHLLSRLKITVAQYNFIVDKNVKIWNKILTLNLSIINHKNWYKLLEIWLRMFIPDSEPGSHIRIFFSIIDPGYEYSGKIQISDQYLQHF